MLATVSFSMAVIFGHAKDACRITEGQLTLSHVFQAAAAMALLGMTKAEEFLPDLTQLLGPATKGTC